MSYISDYEHSDKTEYDEYAYRYFRNRDQDEEEKECCGNCKYHKADKRDYLCTNEDSEYHADYTRYEDGCMEWESK